MFSPNYKVVANEFAEQIVRNPSVDVLLVYPNPTLNQTGLIVKVCNSDTVMFDGYPTDYGYASEAPNESLPPLGFTEDIIGSDVTKPVSGNEDSGIVEQLPFAAYDALTQLTENMKLPIGEINHVFIVDKHGKAVKLFFQNTEKEIAQDQTNGTAAIITKNVTAVIQDSGLSQVANSNHLVMFINPPEGASEKLGITAELKKQQTQKELEEIAFQAELEQEQAQKDTE